jgi:hypothetical protein
MSNTHSISFRIVVLLWTCSLLSGACQRKSQVEDPGVWKKISLDFKRIDPDGLAGPSGGKVAVHYEFCLPMDEKYWKKVQKIDKTAQKNAGSAGRIGCRKDQWLIIGSTHQSNYLRVLYELASQPYIEKIQETFWE